MVAREKVSNRRYKRLRFNARRSFLVGSLNLRQDQNQHAALRLPVPSFSSRLREKVKLSRNGSKVYGCIVSVMMWKIETMVSAWLSSEAGSVIGIRKIIFNGQFSRYPPTV